ncbi:hypothetical protein BV25DRAFT_1913406 [Artomyces pyxidatus]|uniref:Uncharacterized protein n=1 Tax=Artomyces pyxidatus TaxID=48021 RepID=A0ACB8TBF3_9AGAM|nr:hypothetical protein BV25DRAFT_1913406 [Artomyces pyxidatus]
MVGSACAPDANAAADSNASSADKPSGSIKPLVKDLADVASSLKQAAITIRCQLPWNPEWIMLSAHCFLDNEVIDTITHDFLLLDSADALQERLKGKWRYWDVAGGVLWEHVERISAELRVRLEERKEQAREKRKVSAEKMAAKKVHTALEQAGLANVKRVILLVDAPDKVTIGSSAQLGAQAI